MREPAPDSRPVSGVRRPIGYLWWLVRQQSGRVLLGAIWGTGWLVSLMVPPYLLSQAIDRGVGRGDLAAAAGWATAIMGVGALIAVLGLLRHRTMTQVRLDATFRSTRLLLRHATELGASLPRRMTAGEAVTVGTSDVAQISQTLTIAGPGVGSVIAFAVGAVLLMSISIVLGIVVLVGVPLLVGVVGPLISRLHVRQDQYRRLDGALTSTAGDIVQGLRVLCGVSGKAGFQERYTRRAGELRDTGYRVGAVTSWIDALAGGVPALFLAVVIWLAARMAVAGDITSGQLVAVFGYVAVLVTPVAAFVEGANDLGRGIVAAGRVLGFLALRPDTADSGMASPAPADTTLYDPGSGLTIQPGRLSAVVATRLADVLELTDRLARLVESDARLGGVPLADLQLADVRRAVVLADNDAYVFGGRLRDVLGVSTDEQAASVVRAAVAADVVQGLPDGLDGEIRPRASNLSGGQRQRVRLARCLAADPPVLILIEPTSSVDALTESLVVERVSAMRTGRTTLVITSSPQWLHRADEVAFLVDGRVSATGTHAELLAGDEAYRSFVTSVSSVDPSATWGRSAR